MGYSSDLAAYRAQIANYDNQISENRRKIEKLEDEIMQLKQISSNIDSTENQICCLVDSYIKLENSPDFVGDQSGIFFQKQDTIENETQNYLNNTDINVISTIYNEISFKEQEISSLNSQISALERSKANLRMPRRSDYDD